MINNPEWIIYLSLTTSIIYWKSIPLAPGFYTIIAAPVVLVKSAFLTYCISGVNQNDDKPLINLLSCLILTISILTDIRWRKPLFLIEIPIYSYLLYHTHHTTNRFTFAHILNIPSTFALLLIHPFLFTIF
jgi:hypothetical protein